MEKKTLGSFLAVLRKAKGLTQKELAQQLNVSDKAVSRWERDESAPDLSMIPVLAELFDVTCDELLRGERAAPSQPGEEPQPGQTSQKGEKQRRRILAAGMTKYQNQSLLSLGVAGCGLIAALLGNFAFLRAAAGFFAGLVFFLAAALLQAVWRNRAFLTVSDEELVSTQEAEEFRQSVRRRAERVWGATLAMFAATLPPMIDLTDPAYSGLDGLTFLIEGGLAALIVLGIFWIRWFCLEKREDPSEHGDSTDP